MRALILVAGAALAVSACSSNENANNTMNVDENLTTTTTDVNATETNAGTDMNAATDVLIAGAGPAGCATAIACAKRGLEVLLLDRARFPRDKACGEGLLPAGVAALAELGLLAAVRRESTRIGGIDADSTGYGTTYN